MTSLECNPHIMDIQSKVSVIDRVPNVYKVSEKTWTSLESVK